MNNVGSLIIPMPLSEEVMTTQFYDKVDDCETLEYTSNSCKKIGIFRKASTLL